MKVYNTINVSIEEKIAKISFNRPSSSNAISRELLHEFTEALEDLNKNSSVRILLIKGEGDRVFCAGADLKERSSMNRNEILEFLNNFQYANEVLENLPFVTIANINGDAYGGGLEIALSCDFRFMAETAKIGLTEARLGIIPGAGGTQRLTGLIGMVKAKELIYTGRRIDSKKAFEIGLINNITTLEYNKDIILEFCNELLESAPLSIKASKKAIQEGSVLHLKEGLEIERESYLLTLDSEDRIEALTAFKEKRKPIFKGI